MKIGILTWYFGINYGARAHSLALYQTVRNLGYDCEFIQYTSSNTIKKEFYTCTAIEHRHKHPIQTMSGLVKMHKFNQQKKQYPVSKKVYTAEEIDALGYDLIILGSDEIINSNHSLYNDIYYGVGLKNTPYIMYAVSAGTVDQDTKLSKAIDEALSNCKCISVRDHNTAQLIENNTKIKPKIVLDPTLLYDFPVGEPLLKEKYMLIYSFGFLESYKEELIKLSKEKGLRMVCVGRRSEWAEKSIMNANLDEWLNYYRYASLIVTDSYHGFIFAIKNHKNYILIAKDDKTNKIDGLLNLTGTNKTYWNTQRDIVDYYEEMIDYDKVYENLNIHRQASLEYFSTAITK